MNKVESYFAVKGAWSQPGTMELACSLVPDWGKGRHLDLGCGVGKLLAHAREHRGGTAAVGMDLTYKLLHTGREKFNANDNFVQGDAVALPFTDAYFDVVTCTEMLEIVSDLDACLSDIARVLAPGGWFVLSMPTYANLLWLDKRLGDRRLARRRPDVAGIKDMPVGWAPWGPEPTERAVSPWGMRDRLTRLGFKVRRAFTRDFFVTLDRSFLGRGMNRICPWLWQRVERCGPSMDAAIERLGESLPIARFWGYKLFCVCQRTGARGAGVRGTITSTGVRAQTSAIAGRETSRPGPAETEPAQPALCTR